jgi:hypothetical protein
MLEDQKAVEMTLSIKTSEILIVSINQTKRFYSSKYFSSFLLYDRQLDKKKYQSKRFSFT